MPDATRYQGRVRSYDSRSGGWISSQSHHEDIYLGRKELHRCDIGEVYEQPQRRIQTSQCCGRFQTLVTPVANRAPDHGPVLLLDPASGAFLCRHDSTSTRSSF